jgi:hypothetical protein
MDPYLEMHWSDVHQRMCTYASDQLQQQLGGDLVARLGERLVIESLTDPHRSIYPDVRVVEFGLGDVELSAAAGGAAVAEPMVVEVESETEPQAFIEVIEPDSGHLITVVEIISPSNKFGDGRRQYERKQQELNAAQVSLVEIDLIRTGPRIFLLPEVQMPPKARTTYGVCVFRGWRPRKFEVYPIRLQDRLPTIRIPLRQTDPDIVLDLQYLIEQSYHNGGYGRTNYQNPCTPALQGEDAAWAGELLAKR